MLILEISVNGERAFAISAGDCGEIIARVKWERIKDLERGGPTIADFGCVTGWGFESPSKDEAVWPERGIKIGDEVTIRVVEGTEYDQPDIRRPWFDLKTALAERDKEREKRNSK